MNEVGLLTSEAGGFVLAVAAGYGAFLAYTAVMLGWRGVGVGPGVGGQQNQRARLREFVAQAGLEDVRLAELLVVVVILAVVGGAFGFTLFGGFLAPTFTALAAASAPLLAARARREGRRAEAQEAWPRLIEEIRLQATTMGRSVPQALLDVGRRGAGELRPAFAAAHREWLLSTDFDRTVRVLKDRLADPTADAVCETLLIAHEIGGSDLDRRLSALAADRVQDLQGRKDARAKQAGARFARLFVIVVPAGMAAAGWTIGDGRAAFATPSGQIAVLAGLVIIAACWGWAGQIMRLPVEERVFR